MLLGRSLFEASGVLPPGALSIEDVRLRRRHGFTLKIDSIEFPAVGISLVHGPNGSGKSTLLEWLAGTTFRGTGRLGLAGESLTKRDRRRLRQLTGYVPQILTMPAAWTVNEYLDYAAWLNCVSPQDSAQRKAKLSEELALIDILSHRIGSLSGGQKRRVLIAQAFIGTSRVILLDEPYSGLDDQSTGLVTALLKKAAEDVPVVVADHQGRLATDAVKVVKLNNGTLGLDS